MGCVNAKSQENVFKVSNTKFGEGKLEINSKEMIFYRKIPGCETAARIPFALKHLRRYGVDMDTNIFCFEAGRSCMTGEGFYAFRSSQANEMCETLKSYIAGIDSSTSEDVLFSNNLRESQDHLDESLNSLRTQRAMDQSDAYGLQQSTNHRRTFQIRMSSVSGMSPQTVDSETPFLYENVENNNSIIDAVRSSSYVNVTTTTTPSCKSVFSDETIPRNYENFEITDEPTPNEINYTVLETRGSPVKSNGPTKPPVLIKSFSTGSGTNGHTPKSPDSLPYAVIDFQKTNALANAAGNSNGTTGVRKTRHHSEDNFLFEKSRNILFGV